MDEKYYYSNENDMLLHIKAMKEKGYKLLESNSVELHATFEVNKTISSSYTLEEGDPLLEKVGA